MSLAPRVNILKSLTRSSLLVRQSKNISSSFVLTSKAKNAPNIYKKELQAKQIANDNPFETYSLRPEPGDGLYEDLPVIVPSVNPSRIIGCCCEDDFAGIVWFELKKGSTQRCDCGFYFKLVDYDPLDPNIVPTYGKGFGSGLSRYY